MTIQIFGRKKCQETKKAQRFLKERKIGFQFIDLNEKTMAPKELERFFQAIGEEVMDTQSKAYKDGGYAWKEFNYRQELLENQNLLKTPLIRIENIVGVGYNEKWLKSNL